MFQWKLAILPISSLLLGIYLYPSSIVHIISIDNIPGNPHYPYYLVLRPGERLIGTISKLPPGDASIIHVEIRGIIYDWWEPRLFSGNALRNCTFSIESIKCAGPSASLTGGAYIEASPSETFNLNTSDAIHLARAYESKGDPVKALSIYRAFPNHFFSRYRSAVISMDMEEFLRVYHQFPHRKEPLYYLTRYYRTIGNYSECLLYGRAGMLVGSPQYTDEYVEKPIYQYALELEFAHCLYYSGRQEEAMGHWKRLLPVLPEPLQRQINAIKGEK